MLQRTVARKAYSMYGEWWELLGCTSRKRQLVMTLKKAAAELEHLYALHVDTCILGLWVPLLPSVGNSRVIFFRVLHSSYLVVQLRLSIMLPFTLLPNPLSRGRHITPHRPINLSLGNLSLDQGGTWTKGLLEINQLHTYMQRFWIPPSESAHFLVLPKALLLLYFSKPLSILTINFLFVCVGGGNKGFVFPFVLHNLIRITFCWPWARSSNWQTYLMDLNIICKRGAVKIYWRVIWLRCNLGKIEVTRN